MLWTPLRHALGTTALSKSFKMINQYEVTACIVDEIPEIREEIIEASPKLNVFNSIQCLTNYTKSQIQKHDFRKVKKCFSLAEKIYDKGNTLVKIAIENVFVFSFSSLMFSCSREERNKLLAIMPITTGLAIMRMNSAMGFQSVTYSEITQDEKFWKGCESYVNYDVLIRKSRKVCLCNAAPA